ncbi:MAG: hypothetical protein FRX49_03903 [Trebouxia sp. A1-2]|nr:MAG: hypothetical protein FRX49_03903 [Trebouxia sp. A1-2]
MHYEGGLHKGGEVEEFAGLVPEGVFLLLDSVDEGSVEDGVAVWGVTHQTSWLESTVCVVGDKTKLRKVSLVEEQEEAENRGEENVEGKRILLNHRSHAGMPLTRQQGGQGVHVARCHQLLEPSIDEPGQQSPSPACQTLSQVSAWGQM